MVEAEPNLNINRSEMIRAKMNIVRAKANRIRAQSPILTRAGHLILAYSLSRLIYPGPIYKADLGKSKSTWPRSKHMIQAKTDVVRTKTDTIRA